CGLLVSTAKVASTLILVAILTANVAEIGARTLFHTSYAWIFEVNLLLASWLYFLGIVAVYDRSGDITLHGYEQVLRGTALRAYRIALELVIALTFAIIAWFAWTLIVLQLPFRSAGVGIPNAAYTAPLLIGLVGMVLIALRRAIELGE